MNLVRVGGGALALLLLGSLVVPLGCYQTTGYRDQVYYDLGAASEGRGAAGGLADEAVRLNEFLSAYTFEPAVLPGENLSIDVSLGAFRAEQGIGWILLTASVAPLSARERLPKRWVLALDAGASMRGERWTLAIDAACRLAASLGESDKTRLVVFDGSRVKMDAWTDRDGALDALTAWRVKPEGGFGWNGFLSATSIRDALHPYDAKNSPVASPSAAWDAALFYFTDGVGSEKTYWDFRSGTTHDESGRRAVWGAIAKGMKIHVVGLAGGDGAALRRLARESGGGYLFLADSADVDQVLSARGIESFSTAYSDLAFQADGLSDLNHEREERRARNFIDKPVPGCHESARVTSSRRPRDLDIGSLAPGETVVRLFPVELSKWVGRTICIEVKGKDRLGQPISKRRNVYLPVHPLEYPVGGVASNIRKALAVKKQIDYLNYIMNVAVQSKPAEKVDKTEAENKRRAELLAMYATIRETAILLNDEELRRDAVSLEVLARLSDEQIRMLAQEMSPALSPSQQAKRALAMPAKGAMLGVVVGGVVVVGIPLVILGSLYIGCSLASA